MTTGMTDFERWRVAVGFVLLSFAACWSVYDLALHFVARNMEKKNK